MKSGGDDQNATHVVTKIGLEGPNGRTFEVGEPVLAIGWNNVAVLESRGFIRPIDPHLGRRAKREIAAVDEKLKQCEVKGAEAKRRIKELSAEKAKVDERIAQLRPLVEELAELEPRSEKLRQESAVQEYYLAEGLPREITHLGVVRGRAERVLANLGPGAAA